MANEKRLIDANILSDKFKRSFARSIGEARAAYRAAWEETLDAPTVDAEEVVRCKKCAVPHNKWTGCPKLNGLVPPPDFYCAYGERRTDV
jgi:hypothetical protein